MLLHTVRLSMRPDMPQCGSNATYAISTKNAAYYVGVHVYNVQRLECSKIKWLYSALCQEKKKTVWSIPLLFGGKNL